MSKEFRRVWTKIVKADSPINTDIAHARRYADHWAAQVLDEPAFAGREFIVLASMLVNQYRFPREVIEEIAHEALKNHRH